MSTAKQAKITPSLADSKELIGSLKDKIRINGQVLSTGVKWDAEAISD